MIEEFTHEGKWFLPDRPRKRILGTLTYAPEEGATLNLKGAFVSFDDVQKGQASSDIILGVTSEGEKVTLFDCFVTNYQFGKPEWSSYYVNRVFHGAHFKSKDDIKLNTLYVRYLYLDEWVNVDGFDIDYKNLDTDMEISVEYKRPDPIKVFESDDYKISIVFSVNGPTLSFVQTEASIKQQAYIKIEFPKDRPFSECDAISYHIRNLLNLSTRQPVYAIETTGKTRANKQKRNGKPFYPEVNVFGRPIGNLSKPKALLPPFMLFSYHDIVNRVQEVFSKWLFSAESIKPVHDLYFGSLYNPGVYMEQRFLNLAQAIEAYHRLTTGGKDNLSKRLEDILKKPSVILSGQIMDIPELIKTVVISRHYYTHYDRKKREKAAKGQELYQLVQKLSLVLDICLLGELGFNAQQINDLIERNYRYQQEVGLK